ncbi:hypothetical protein ABT354_20355 [Streptomyces sp. NPDC000594]|uniref:hypothetical protein n=1 Tax=Streptomyces sp. NPDC000594 TaxID=3154261 RepID=UPI003329CC28
MSTPAVPIPPDRPVVLNLGMGVDSSAIATRWLLEPHTRGFHLGQLTVLIASVGEEYRATKDAMEEALFPLLAEHRVRTVQVARAGQTSRDGYVTLSDTRTPTRLVTDVPVTLGERMLSVGTVPQVSSTNRSCSDWIKHHALDSWLADNVADAPFTHCIGYNADETRRAERDLDHTKGNRIPDFPLLRWNWTRRTAADYLRTALGREISRSACFFCPFQGSVGGRAALLARWRAEPEAALRALLIEHNALVMNGNAALFGSRAARDVVEEAGLHDILDRHHDQVRQSPWSVYEVRRVFRARDGDPTRKGQAYRSVAPLATGRRRDMIAHLDHLSARYGCTPATDRHGITRAHLLSRHPSLYPTAEHFLAAGPALTQAKARDCFDDLFAAVTGGAPVIAALHAA